MQLPWPAPDHGGRCLTQVVPAAIASLTRSTSPLRLPDADRVVVLLVDGLGEDLLREHAEHAPFLAEMAPAVEGGIDAVFPSTTAASITSLGTGLPTGSHGIVGMAFWLPELGDVLYPLGWRDRPNPSVVQPETTQWQLAERMGIAVSIVGPRQFDGSGLTTSALRGGRYVGADSPGETVVAVSGAVQGSPPCLAYGYFSTVDKSGHIHGAGSEQWLIDLEHTDRAIRQLAERVPAGTLLVVTGDHGMVNCPDEARVSIDGRDFAVDVRRVAGEPRMRHVYTEPGADAAEVAQRWQRLLGERAVVLTRAQAIDAGLFGSVAPGVDERIGDVLALPTGDGALTMQADSIVSGLRGQHGGLTAAERRVPLLVWQAG